MLQYPIYGGIMGIMTATGLAQIISSSIAASASAETLPVLSFVSSIFISLIIPSGGGHWAVQGPFTISPPPFALNASIPATTMAVAMGEEVAKHVATFLGPAGWWPSRVSASNAWMGFTVSDLRRKHHHLWRRVIAADLAGGDDP